MIPLLYVAGRRRKAWPTAGARVPEMAPELHLKNVVRYVSRVRVSSDGRHLRLHEEKHLRVGSGRSCKRIL